MSGKKYPIGVPLTEFGNELANKKYDSVNSEWQELYFGSAFIGITLDDAEYMQEQLEVVEEKVIFVFDFAITAVSLFRDFIFFLPNFMNADYVHCWHLVQCFRFIIKIRCIFISCYS